MKYILLTLIMTIVNAEYSKAQNNNYPKLFLKEKIATRASERDMAISKAGNLILFTVQSFRREKSIIVEISMKNGIWNKPKTVSFSGTYNDLEPAFSPKDGRLYFVSNRPVIDSIRKNDHDIWYVNRVEGAWSKPVHTGEIINTEKDEFYPSKVNDGSIYFTATYEETKGREDIYYAKWDGVKFLKPVSLDTAINTDFFEFNAFVDPAERYILFSSFGRKDDLGGGDLYMSAKDQNGNWEQAKNLGKDINSKSLDYCPFVSTDGKILYFTSNRNKINTIHKPIFYLDLLSELNGIFNGYDNLYFMEFDVSKF